MTTFQYKGFDKLGKSSKGLVEAADIKQARERLASKGILTERIEAAGHKTHYYKSGFPGSTRIMLYNELYSLLKAGIPLAQALDMTIHFSGEEKLKPAIAFMRDQVKEGAAFADALTNSGINAGDYEITAIKAGEKTGMLDQTLKQIAEYIEKQNKLQEHIISISIYPAIIIIIALLIAVGLLGIAMPRFADMLATETNITLPALTVIMINISKFLRVWGIIIILAAIAIVFGLNRWIHKEQKRIESVDKRLFTIPLLGKGYNLLANLRFTRTFSMLIQGSVPLIEALKLSGKATGSPWISKLAEEQSDAVTHGASLSDALSNIEPFSTTMAEWAKVGETTGTLNSIFNNAAERFEYQWEKYISRLTSLIEPILFIIIGLFVLLLALSIFLPIMQLNQQLL
jgi:general secretion pathway protein F